jgi:uncharacterized membrane protein YhaH (DUF805 family)
MNKYQKYVVAAGIFLIILCALFPPYHAEYRQQGHDLKKFFGYHFILSPPTDIEIFKFLKGELPVASIGTSEKEVLEFGRNGGKTESHIERALQVYRQRQQEADRKIADPLLQKTSYSLDTARVWLQVGLITAVAVGGVVLLQDQRPYRRPPVEESPLPDEITTKSAADVSNDVLPFLTFPIRESAINQSGFQYWKYVFLGFKGRISRRVFLFASLAHVMAIVLIMFGSLCEIKSLNYLSWAMIPFLLYTGFALLIKRLHDADYSGWWILLGLAPYVGGLVVFGLCYLMRGTVGSNDYGEEPAG